MFRKENDTKVILDSIEKKFKSPLTLAIVEEALNNMEGLWLKEYKKYALSTKNSSSLPTDSLFSDFSLLKHFNELYDEGIKILAASLIQYNQQLFLSFEPSVLTSIEKRDMRAHAITDAFNLIKIHICFDIALSAVDKNKIKRKNIEKSISDGKQLPIQKSILAIIRWLRVWQLLYNAGDLQSCMAISAALRDASVIKLFEIERWQIHLLPPHAQGIFNQLLEIADTKGNYHNMREYLHLPSVTNMTAVGLEKIRSGVVPFIGLLKRFKTFQSETEINSATELSKHIDEIISKWQMEVKEIYNKHPVKYDQQVFWQNIEKMIIDHMSKTVSLKKDLNSFGNEEREKEQRAVVQKLKQQSKEISNLSDLKTEQDKHVTEITGHIDTPSEIIENILSHIMPQSYTLEERVIKSKSLKEIQSASELMILVHEILNAQDTDQQFNIIKQQNEDEKAKALTKEDEQYKNLDDAELKFLEELATFGYKSLTKQERFDKLQEGRPKSPGPEGRALLLTKTRRTGLRTSLEDTSPTTEGKSKFKPGS